MDRFKALLITLAGISIFSTAYAASSPIGYWKSVDDSTGKPQSIIHIWQKHDKSLAGEIVKTFNKEQPKVGTIILSGLTPKEDQWDNGKLFDINNGKTYSCHLRLADNGKKLDIRGYIGFPLLGKSQTWTRVDLLSDADKFERIQEG